MVGGLIGLFQKSPYGWSGDQHLVSIVLWDVGIIMLGFLLLAFLTKRFLLAPPTVGKSLNTWYGR